MSASKDKITLFWFRRDLRLEDNAGLYHAFQHGSPVQPVFIFDTTILDELEDRDDARVSFIHQEIERLADEVQERGGALDVRVGKPVEIWEQLTQEYQIDTVFFNRDYEPSARKRDQEVATIIESKGIQCRSYKDHVIFEQGEILKDDQKPYTVYTPYSKRWKERLRLNPESMAAIPSESQTNWNVSETKEKPTLPQLGFSKNSISFPARDFSERVVTEYDKTRDFPAIAGTSKLSLHLRFGTISTRALVRWAKNLNEKYLNELIWREFYQAILWHFPHVVNQNFNRKYDHLIWSNNEDHFKKWCEGLTGYPIVDAGMRELNQTGYMHNRVRMITASFLTKHLLIDWRWGEAYFARKLLDFELASNNGGWQWAASTGVDAAPYFRIFNPYTQAEKFDPQSVYIKKWVAEYGTPDYPSPIVDHKAARERALSAYKETAS